MARQPTIVTGRKAAYDEGRIALKRSTTIRRSGSAVQTAAPARPSSSTVRAALRPSSPSTTRTEPAAGTVPAEEAGMLRELLVAEKRNRAVLERCSTEGGD